MANESDTTPRPGITAVGSYLRYLREAAGLTLAETANKVGIDQSQIWRIESGKTDTKGSFLFKFLSAVGGEPSDIALLINNPSATKDDGEAIARLRRQISK